LLFDCSSTLDGGPVIGYVSGLTKSGVTGLRAERIARLSA